MSLNPADRPASAAQMRLQLRLSESPRAVSSNPLPPTLAPTPPVPPDSHTKRAPSRFKSPTTRPILIGALSGIGVLLVVLLIAILALSIFGGLGGEADQPAEDVIAPEPTQAIAVAETPTYTPTPTETATAVAETPTYTPTATAPPSPPTPSPLASTATASSLPTSELRRVGNGEDLVASPASSSLTVDGDLSEWSGEGINISNVVFQPETWQSPQDLSGVVRAAYDEQFLYLAVRVIDDVMVQESTDRFLHRGDAVELFWVLALAEDFAQDSYSEDEAQMLFSPGNFEGNRPSSWVYISPTGNFHDQIVVASSQSTEGYDIEIAIPWAGVNLTPRPGTTFGYAVALSDNDTPGTSEQQTQLSTSPQLPFQHPARWGNLILE